MHINIKDLGAGLLFLAIGLFFALNAWLNLPIGSGYPMGPGFFPIGLGVLLCCFGAGLIVKAARSDTIELGMIPKRGLPLIVLSILAFAAMVENLGALPAFAASTFLAAMAPDDATWKSALAMTGVLTVFCILVFIYALGLPYPLISPWLMGY